MFLTSANRIVSAFVIFLLLLSHGFVKKEAMKNTTGSVVRLKKVDKTTVHTVVIAVSQNNLNLLHDMLMERADPNNSLYQKWLTFEEIGNLTNNVEAFQTVITWLSNHTNVKIESISPRLDFITVSAPIITWEILLNTTFYSWKDLREGGKKRILHLCEQYSVPLYLHDHILTIFGTCQLPIIPLLNRKSLPHNNATNLYYPKRQRKLSPLTTTTLATVANLNLWYGIPSNSGSSTIGQAVFESDGESFEQSDLLLFQSTYGLIQQAAIPINTKPLVTGCGSTSCNEGSLDIQYVMGVAQKSPSYFWYVSTTSPSFSGDPFFDFLFQVAATPNPPKSLSISWTTFESYVGTSRLNLFNNEAMKLSLMGVTILAATGDDGVAGTGCLCGYNPLYPASSPYVVAVGATQGPESSQTEIACQSQLGGVITSGGGFSNFYKQPSYQQAAVSSYLNSPTGQSVPSGFSNSGRAYPDISFIGVDYVSFIGGSAKRLFGTSASTPVAAALITLVNSQRQAAGLPTVGFINPTLYANMNKFNDVISGRNNCCSSTATPACCNVGFEAAPGWDPVTGLGSISYKNLYNILSTSSQTPSTPPTTDPSLKPSFVHSIPPISQQHRTVNPTTNPSFKPTKLPSVMPTPLTPTIGPTTEPAMIPSTEPTFPPSFYPTRKPTLQPSVAPSRRPSRSPTAIPSMFPTNLPTSCPTTASTFLPTSFSSVTPSLIPTNNPSSEPSLQPSFEPTILPSKKPSRRPIYKPSKLPTNNPTSTIVPSVNPTLEPSFEPSTIPSIEPSIIPTHFPSFSPSLHPTATPTKTPSNFPTILPSLNPSKYPTKPPLATSSMSPSFARSVTPTTLVSTVTSVMPSNFPIFTPNNILTTMPNIIPPKIPLTRFSIVPNIIPTSIPSVIPSGSSAVSSIVPSTLLTISSSLVPNTLSSSTPSIIPFTGPNTPPSSIIPSKVPLITSSSMPNTISSPPALTLPSILLKPSIEPSKLPVPAPSVIPSTATTFVESITPSTYSMPSSALSTVPVATVTTVNSMCPTMTSSMFTTPISTISSVTDNPTRLSSRPPSLHPFKFSSRQPSNRPSRKPSKVASKKPNTARPQLSTWPSKLPTLIPFFTTPTTNLSQILVSPYPTSTSTLVTATNPILGPSPIPTTKPSSAPSKKPTSKPSKKPTRKPSKKPIKSPSRFPTFLPTLTHTIVPTIIQFAHASLEPSSAKQNGTSMAPFFTPTLAYVAPSSTDAK